MSKAQPIRPVRLNSIEACRGVAATMVVAAHCGHTLGAPANFGAPPFGLLFQFGRSGADIFFVLSGFLISFIHWRDLGHPERLGHYLARRITRIYPTYWLVLLAVVPVDIMTHTLYDRYDEPLELLKNLFLLPQNDQIIDVCWSLCNELLFYALFGLMIFNRTAGLIAISLWIPAMIARLAVAPHVDTAWFNLLTYPMNFEFVAGVGAGWLMQRREIRRPGVVLAAGLIVFTVFAIAEDHRLLWSNEPHIWFPGVYWYVLLLRCLGYGMAGVLIITGLSALELQGRIRVPRALLVLGGASYLLYLIHVPALLVLGASERRMHLLRFVPPWLLATTFVALIIACTIAVHLAVEKPLLRAVRPRKAATGSTQQTSVIV
jgi:exopolysaccharide production protein ExoZ